MGWSKRCGAGLAGQIAEIAVWLDETAVESHTTIEGREVRDVIRKPYKTPNKKENWPKSFPGDYLWTLGKGVLY